MKFNFRPFVKVKVFSNLWRLCNVSNWPLNLWTFPPLILIQMLFGVFGFACLSLSLCCCPVCFIEMYVCCLCPLVLQPQLHHVCCLNVFESAGIASLFQITCPSFNTVFLCVAVWLFLNFIFYYFSQTYLCCEQVGLIKFLIFFCSF